MKQKFINDVLQGMLSFLNNVQAAQLQKATACCCKFSFVELAEARR